MAIISIRRDWGVGPSTIRMSTTDSLNVVASSGYLTAQAANLTALNSGPFGFVIGDTILVSASDGSEEYHFNGDDFSTLIPNTQASTIRESTTYVDSSPYT